LKHRTTVAALLATAAILIGACADSTTTAPAPSMDFTTNTTFKVRNPKTHVLEVVPRPTFSGGGENVMAAITGSGSMQATILPANSPGMSAGKDGSITYTYTDSARNTHHAIFLYAGAGPPTAVQSYVNTKLVSVTALTWTRVPGGYYNSKQVLQAVSRSGTALGSYTEIGEVEVVTAPCNPKVDPNCGPPKMVLNTGPNMMQKGLGYLGLALANVCFPSDALAQFGMHFADCALQWFAWGFAFAGVYGAAASDLAAPGAVALAVSAWGLASVALKLLVDCMVQHDQTASTGAIGGGGGAGGGGSDGDKICEMGSFAAHCTTPFTL
jgi:hypothetical protein